MSVSFLGLLLAPIVGLLVGSFLAALVLRLPKRLPIVMDRSACPKCGHRLGAFELIPVLSWLIQRRHCRACGGRISAFYPLMEIASALIALAAFWRMPWFEAAFACVAGWAILAFGAWVVRKRWFGESASSRRKA
jgi:leader peptidase (prepilin peptidase)/N-methyltransferase